MKKMFNATYIYALLIFIGYYNYHSYYSCFDIKISSFLTSGELLLSFLPFTLPILTIIGIIAVFYIRFIVEIAFDKKKDRDEESENKRDAIFSLYTLSDSYKNIKKLLKEMSWKSFGDIFILFLNFIRFLLGIAVFIFFIGYILHFLNRILLKDTFLTLSVGELIIYALFWFIIFDNLLEENLNKESNAVQISLLLFLLLFSIGIIKIGNIEDANKVLQGESTTYIEFDYDSKIVKSTKEFVYVGRTDKYIFMRQLKEAENYIFPIENIGKVVMKINKESDKESNKK